MDREFDAELINLDDFDDGVLVDLANGVVTFTVSTAGSSFRYGPAAPIHVHGWFDWNGNGNWDDPGEFALNWSGYPGDGSWPLGASTFVASEPIAVPGNLMFGDMWSRFRLDYAQNLENVTGYANYGEVEDHRLFVSPIVPIWANAINVDLSDPLVLAYGTSMVVDSVTINFTPSVSNTVLWSGLTSPLEAGTGMTATISHDPFEPSTTYTVSVSDGLTSEGHRMPATSFTFTTESLFGVDVSADMAQTGVPGAMVTYHVMVTNTGSTTDTFDLALAGQSWTVTPPPTTMTLAEGASMAVNLSVTIPTDAQSGEMDTATLTVTSQNDPTQTVSVAFTTTAVVDAADFNLFLPFIIKDSDP